MNNIIYNNFKKEFIENRHTNPIDLTLPHKYCVALFNSLYKPESEEGNTFYDLQNKGRYEVEDLFEIYEPGGKEITFRLCESENNNQISYTANNVYWEDTKIFDARYAIIYIKDTGMLISCHDLGQSVSTDDENLLINWGDASVLTFTIDPEKEEIIDNNLSTKSENALQNKTVTDAFKNLGVIFTDDLNDAMDDPYRKDIPSILPENYVKADTFEEGQEYYINIDLEYIYVPHPVAEEIGKYYTKHYTEKENFLNTISYITTLKKNDIDTAFNEVIGE